MAVENSGSTAMTSVVLPPPTKHKAFDPECLYAALAITFAVPAVISCQQRGNSASVALSKPSLHGKEESISHSVVNSVERITLVPLAFLEIT